ncbi:MAG: gliding motility-associated C-terminal domain-containing protein [Bacteroidota bacterium]
MKLSFFYIFFIVISVQNVMAQLTVNAGADMVVCYNGSITIGGSPSATAGVTPYKYSWQPSTYLNSTTIANPIASNITSDISYTLTVTDFDTTIVSDVIFLNLDKIFTFNAGIDTGYCYSQSGGVTIGASHNNNAYHNFNWLPTTDLSNPTDPRPLANPSVTTIYTLTVSDSNCPNFVTTVKVTPFEPPFVDAGRDTTINEGDAIALYGIGGSIFWWSPDYNIKYRPTSHPDVYPITTTIYTLATQDQHGCYAEDYVTITVINGDQLFFYNTFTPNNDGENDVFYIGNLEKYPDNNLKIYNRYGKQIYNASNYDNLWDGTYLGNKVPTGTYFYILNDGKDKQYKGSVTILR